MTTVEVRIALKDGIDLCPNTEFMGQLLNVKIVGMVLGPYRRENIFKAISVN